MIEPRLDPEVIHNETELLAAAIHIDRYILDAMDRLEEDFAALHSLTMQTFNQLNKNKFALNDKVMRENEVPGDDVTRNLESITSYNEKMEKSTDTPKSRLQKLCICCERSVSFYDEVFEAAVDEAVSLTAQSMASLALDRIEILKHALGNECGCNGLFA